MNTILSQILSRFSWCYGGGFLCLSSLAPSESSTAFFSAGTSWPRCQNFVIVALSRSSRLRYHLINMRMNRYFKKSSKVAKIETFVCKCKLGDWWAVFLSSFSSFFSSPSPYSSSSSSFYSSPPSHFYPPSNSLPPFWSSELLEF